MLLMQLLNCHSMTCVRSQVHAHSPTCFHLYALHVCPSIHIYRTPSVGLNLNMQVGIQSTNTTFFQNFMWMCDAWAGVWQNIYQLLNMWKSVRSIDRLCFLLDLTDILKVEILLDNTSGKITIPAGFKYSQVMYLFWHTPPVPHRQGTRYSWDGAKFCQLSSSFSFLFIFW